LSRAICASRITGDDVTRRNEENLIEHTSLPDYLT
jgi:hypothetical protein